jgi:zinc protease
MIKFFLNGFVLSVFGMGVVFAKPMINVQYWQAKNNVPVYFVSEPQLPMVDVAVVFRAGSAHDAKQYGVAGFVASMLDQGAGKQDAEAIAGSFDKVGAKFETDVDEGMTVVSLRSLVSPTLRDPALNTFRLLLTKANFPQEALARIRQQKLVELQAEAQSAPKRAYKAFIQTVYAGTPYAHLAIGEPKTIAAITQADLSRFYHRYYVASNAFIVMVGDLRLAQAKQIADWLTANLPAGHPANVPKLKKASASAVVKAIQMSLPQTAIVMGGVGIARNNSDYFPLLLSNYILGGGMQSRLFKAVREQQGLSYNVSSQFTTWQVPGPFLFKLQTKNQSTGKAIDLVRQVVGDYVKKGPSAQELAEAKQYFSNSFALQFSSNAAILSKVIYLVYFKLPLDYYDHYLDQINSVKLRDVSCALKKHINVGALTTVSAGG